MIEVEQKFLLDDGDEERLRDGAEFVDERIMDDTYFDTAECALGKRDRWLRLRDGRFELKIPLRNNSGITVQQYRELENDDSIRNALGLGEGELSAILREHEYLPVAHYKTTRKKFKKDGFTIDFDLADYGDFIYRIAEIELMVQKPEEMPAAGARIQEFAHKYGLKTIPVRGKLIEYFRRKKPEIYHLLKEHGVIKAI